MNFIHTYPWFRKKKWFSAVFFLFSCNLVFAISILWWKNEQCSICLSHIKKRFNAKLYTQPMFDAIEYSNDLLSFEFYSLDVLHFFFLSFHETLVNFQFFFVHIHMHTQSDSQTRTPKQTVHTLNAITLKYTVWDDMQCSETMNI